MGKGINRGIATLCAGALGVGAHHLANLAGEEGEPILLGILVFILGIQTVRKITNSYIINFYIFTFY